jgi:hypothetical protein
MRRGMREGRYTKKRSQKGQEFIRELFLIFAFARISSRVDEI